MSGLFGVSSNNNCISRLQTIQPNSSPQPLQSVQPVKTESQVNSNPNFCKNCGAALHAGVKFCSEYGHQL